MPDATITVATSDGEIGLYEATPDAEATRGVIVLQEVFGVNDHIRDVTRRFAALGFHAIAPHIYHRTGSPEMGYTETNRSGPHVAALTDALVVDDLDVAIGRMHDAGLADRSIGIVGFCQGGRYSFLAALERPLGAAVGFYGSGIATQSRVHTNPALIERSGELKAPWLGLFGDHDPLISTDDVDRLREYLKEHAPVDTEVVRYADAGHGFHCDARDAYHEPSAKDAWARTQAWFDRYLS